MTSPSVVLLSSRRPRRSRQRAARGGQDWLWVLSFGVVVVFIVGAFFLLSGTIGGSTTCAKPLAPLGDETPLSPQAFQEEDTLLTHVSDLAASGNRSEAESAFYGKVHNFTHNVDPPIREKDKEVGKELCRAVLDLEEALTSETSTINLSTKVGRVRELLREGAVALGYPRPG